MNASLLVLKKPRIALFSERKAFRERSRLTFAQTYFLLLATVAVLGVSYVWMLNASATKGYDVRNLEIEKKRLTYQDSLLAIRIAEAESLTSLTSHPAMSVMEPIETPKYLVYEEKALAWRKP